MNGSERSIDGLLKEVIAASPEGADLVLDLRELLLERGHPGKCVLCFFRLLGDLRKPGALRPLGHWLEQHLEVAVSVDGQVVEALPVRLAGRAGIEEFCEAAIETVRSDRCYQGNSIALAFRYKPVAMRG